ncbi:MAG TPA: hypothetical protein PKD27_02220 [Tepidiformaceae bacterium]|nr:hypothetical protein [Tepidiformaceae bacterium]
MRPEKKEFGGPFGTDQPGQEPREPAVRRKGTFDEHCAETRLLAGDADIERRTQPKTAADGHAVDGRDHRLVGVVDVQNGAADEADRVHGVRALAVFVNAAAAAHGLKVGAGTPASPLAGDDDGPDAVVHARFIDGGVEVR